MARDCAEKLRDHPKCRLRLRRLGSCRSAAAQAVADGDRPEKGCWEPRAARDFVRLGYDRKDKLTQWIAENSTVPAREYWDDQWVQTLVKPHAIAGIEPWATMLKAAPDEPVQKYRAEEISIVVLGGETQGAIRLISGSLSRAKTVLIDEWR